VEDPKVIYEDGPYRLVRFDRLYSDSGVPRYVVEAKGALTATKTQNWHPVSLNDTSVSAWLTHQLGLVVENKR